MDNIFLLTVISTVLSFVMTPFIKKFAVKVNAVSIPKDARRIHKKPMPLLGGLAIYFSFVIVTFLKKGPLLPAEKGILIGASIIAIYGFLDDIYDLKPWQKLLFQCCAACVVIYFNVNIGLLTNPFTKADSFVKIGWLSYPLTIVWIVGVTNAINLIDGLDGLAAGIALISSVTICIISLMNGRMESAVLLAILGGAILGFIPFNFNPASIFMGEIGSAMLGFLLSSISIQGAVKSATAFAIAVPILALGLPIYDTLFAIVRRKLNGKPISQADRGHLHHRLLDMGLTQRQAVIIMYLISAILGAIAIIAMVLSTRNSYFLLALVVMILVIIAWKFGFFKHKE